MLTFLATSSVALSSRHIILIDISANKINVRWIFLSSANVNVYSTSLDTESAIFHVFIHLIYWHNGNPFGMEKTNLLLWWLLNAKLVVRYIFLATTHFIWSAHCRHYFHARLRYNKWNNKSYMRRINQSSFSTVSQ